jgi:hypothetical protein
VCERGDECDDIESMRRRENGWWENVRGKDG